MPNLSWKNDSLYQRIFREVDRIRSRFLSEESRPGIPPDGFRVEEHSWSDWTDRSSSSRAHRVWIVDEFGPRLFPGLKQHDHDPGVLRGAYWQYGLVRFCITDDRSHVSISIAIGPRILPDLGFEVIGGEDDVDLVLRQESLSGRS